MLKGKKILIGVTGGIAAYKICQLVRLLVKEKAEVKIIMTPSAEKFVSPVTLSTLSKNEVLIDLFPKEIKSKKSKKINIKTWHVDLGLWADLMLIAPATLNTIGKIVNGICDNLLLATVYSARCPVMIAPAMDEDMFKHPVTKNNIELSRNLNYKVIDPEKGELASGLVGTGRMAEPESIFKIVKDHFEKTRDLKGKKILITAGPTVEQIDPVRFITNASSGKMGYETARAAKERGADVTLISGPVMIKSEKGIKKIDVKSAEQMFKAVKKNLNGKDLIIMSAAVEDLVPVIFSRYKIKKKTKDKIFNIAFKPAIDILKYLGEIKKTFKLIGFALETDNDLNNAKEKLKSKNLDMIVMNNLNDKGAGFGYDTNVVTFINSKSPKKLKKMSKYEIGNKILDEYLKM
jgi:phosphopantothenoylcysteine decarboxylase / phosphopantothenate---cysteine ligase